MAVAELMQILLDEANLGWDQAWDLTSGPWPTRITPCCRRPWRNGRSLVRGDSAATLEIIYEINRRFLDTFGAAFLAMRAVRALSLIEEGPEAGPHGEPGDRRLAQHQRCCGDPLRAVAQTTVRDLAEMFPERFNNKTNGVTPRRWLLLANPALAGSSPKRSATTGSPISPRSQVAAARRRRRLPRRIPQCKREAKARFADWLKATSGQAVDPDIIFDCQIKRIHEYKRQLLNVLPSSCL